MQVRVGNQQTQDREHISFHAGPGIAISLADDAVGNIDLTFSATTSGAAYTLTSDGTTVTGVDKTGATVATGTDGGAVLQAIFAAMPQSGSAVSFRNDGNVFPWRTVPLIPAGVTGLLLLNGNGATVQTKVAAGYALVGLNRTADYQTFQNITIRDFVVDRNNIDGGSTNGVVCHFMAQRAHMDKITFHNIRSVNVPDGGTNDQIHYLIQSKHLAASETQTNVTNITADLIDMQGGNQGFIAIGNSGDTTCEVFHDRIAVTRWSWKRDATPTVTGDGAAVQIAGRGFGNTCTIRDGYCLNSTDVGVEVDGMSNAFIENVEVVDAFNVPFFVRNFHAPQNTLTQKATFRSCTARYVSYDPGLVNKSAFLAGAVGAPGFGHAIYNDCKAYYAKLSLNNFTGLALYATSGVERVTVDGFLFSCPTMADTSVGTTFNDVFKVNCTASGGFPSVAHIRNVTAEIVGSTTNTTAQIRLFFLAGGVPGHELDLTQTDTDIKVTMSGMGVGMLIAFSLGNTVGDTNKMNARISRTNFLDMTTGSTTITGFSVPTSTRLTVVGMLEITDSNFAEFAHTGSEFSIDPTQMSHVRVSGNTYLTRPAPVALTGLVTATGAPLATSWDAVAVFGQGSGASVTAIDVSTDGGTTYTNVLTQSSAALPAGFDQTVGPLRPDALIKATFTGTQPTVTLVPVNP